ncbi:putative Histidinol-phosphate transaminase [Crenothrix polyspora]|uniref:histidinol-phosphate transaminase n=1 Tax=Crenothrix polyspora TaxID=360316 RepID=A0A1R4HCC1_9GAMM|nr:putative Histidinol-phosphate transaminase [Crenothrix polyspora]
MIFDTYLNDEDYVLFPVPSYSNALNLLKMSSKHIHIIRALEIQDIKEALNNTFFKLIYLTSPNNPTGYIIEPSDIKFLAKQYPSTFFVIDGCYIEYDENSLIYDIDLPNVIIVRTFSKAFGLAGLRIGYMYSRADTTAKLAILRDPHLPTEIAKQAAYVALINITEYRLIWKEMRENRKWFMNELSKRNILVNHDSKGMFIMAKLTKCSNSELSKYLIENHGILIKVLKGEIFGLDNNNYIRIGISNRQNLTKLLTAIDTFIQIGFAYPTPKTKTALFS